MNLCYRESGNMDAPLMVFLHGGGVSGWMWEKQHTYFTDFHCLVPDLPGHGKTGGESFSIEETAQAVSRLIVEKRGDQPVIVVGFSLGAQILITLLASKNNLIDFAVINSALVKPILFPAMLIKTMALFFPLSKNRIFARLQARSMYIDSSLFNQYFQDVQNMKEAIFSEIMEQNFSFRLPDNFGQTSAKILATVGAKEKSIMKKSWKEIVESHKMSEGVMFSDIGHGAPLANSETFNRVVRKWLKDNTYKQT